MQRIKIGFAYDGTQYHGWAKQPGLRTVQQALEDAMQMIFRTDIRTIVAGRTDAGVHALEQVVHADVPVEAWKAVPRNAPFEASVALLRRLNGILAKDDSGILIKHVAEVTSAFDARFTALRRSYKYLIADGLSRWNPLHRHFQWQIKQELDVEQMNLGAQQLLGLHDFLSFCRPREHSTTIRTLEYLAFTRTESGVLEAEVVADAFCHNMVRSLVAACVQVGLQEKTVPWLLDRIQNPRRDSETRLAPSHGLILVRVEYPPQDQWALRSAQTRARRSSVHGPKDQSK